ncbi:excalibur calcium-binding domain-containing protein [Ruegeria arenilitoris]|uniref:excalibur calcium-binding domain-containing protein n=1 Tax=Ruegeria arenilitoris TaxID=1173585 RepID=UPI003C7ABD51
MIEAELGTRGETHSGLYNHLGRRTSSAVGQTRYQRNNTQKTSIDSASCSDFASSAEAQKFFLASGGPVHDPHNLDGDGDGLACEWGTQLKRINRKYKYTPKRRTSSRCYVGPRGGTYTITASGRKNYGGC